MIHLKQNLQLQNPCYLIKGKWLNNCCGHLRIISWCQCVANIMDKCSEDEFNICSVPLFERCCLQQMVKSID